MATALSVAVVGFHVVKTAGLLINRRRFPSLRRGMAARERATSLLVPARDEEHNLRHTLLGLVKQPAVEILVLDDGSSDGTAAVVRALSAVDGRVRLIAGKPLPEGWTGKNWACHQLAEQAVGELLVFCDADVTMRAGALPAIWAAMDAQRAEVFSVFPRQRAESLGERMLVPLIDETLLAFLPTTNVGVANGQVFAFSREAYARVGGHRAVRAEVVEDLALARLAGRVGLALGGDLISARMYRGYWETVHGFGKSLRLPGVVMAASAGGHLLAYTVPWLRRGRAWRVAAVLGLAERVLTNAKTGRGAYAEALLVPAIPVAALPVYGAGLRRTARWKGREYP